MFLNLIVNAAHAIEDNHDNQKGHITISTRQKDGYVEIRIADTGCGIPLDIRNKVFEPFLQPRMSSGEQVKASPSHTILSYENTEEN